jgi:CheY-like chemotaxis protein
LGETKPLRSQSWIVLDEHEPSRRWASLLLEIMGAKVTQISSLAALAAKVRSNESWSGVIAQGDIHNVQLYSLLGEKSEDIPWFIRCVPMGNALNAGGLWLTQPLKPSSAERMFMQLEHKQAEEPPTANPQTQNNISGAGRNILLVEDNPINFKLAMRVLEKAGFSTKGATNGVEALEMLAQYDFDAVLMDVQMPVMDGLAATRGIRSGVGHVRNSAITIIAMTANAMEGDRELCLAAGMNDYLTKPIQPAQVIEVIQKWMK